eukprot:6997296-Lingulodinium_polyedra.AAC.1
MKLPESDRGPPGRGPPAGAEGTRADVARCPRARRKHGAAQERTDGRAKGAGGGPPVRRQTRPSSGWPD